MSSVELDFTEFADFKAAMLDWGGSLIPIGPGEELRFNRNGSRHIAEYLVDFDDDEEARQFHQKLKRAKSAGAIAPFPQIGLIVGQPGSPLVNGAHAGGTSLALKSLMPHYVIREGQYLSITVSGRRYLYSVDAMVKANSSGNATVTITPGLRTTLAGNEAVELARVQIEGALIGEQTQWQIAVNGHEPFAFGIREMR